MNETWVLQQLFSGGLTWAQVAVVASLFLAAIFRPERIVNPGLFRLAGILLALSIVLPPILNGALVSSMGSSPGPPFRVLTGPSSLIAMVGPLFFGVALCCGLFSLIPSSPASAPLPPRHPLD